MQDDNTERLAKIDKLDPGQAETILKIVVERLSVNEPHSSGNQVPLDFRDELSTTFEDASESERDDFAKATLRFLSSDQEAADLIGDALMDAEGAKLVDPGTVAIVAVTLPLY